MFSSDPSAASAAGAVILRVREQAAADFAAQRQAYAVSGEAQRDQRAEEIRREWVAARAELDRQADAIDKKYQALLAAL